MTILELARKLKLNPLYNYIDIKDLILILEDTNTITNDALILALDSTKNKRDEDNGFRSTVSLN